MEETPIPARKARSEAMRSEVDGLVDHTREALLAPWFQWCPGRVTLPTW